MQDLSQFAWLRPLAGNAPETGICRHKRHDLMEEGPEKEVLPEVAKTYTLSGILEGLGGRSRMSKLKEQILRSAWQLFRERGYENVSLRAIAEHAGTTIGNLTYHYPQKEDLLCAMQISTQGEALAQYGSMPETPEDILRELHAMIERTENILRERAFYFNSIFNLCRDVPPLRTNVEKIRDIVYNIYLSRFEALRNSGYMRADVPMDVYSNLILGIILSISSWLYVQENFHDRASQASIAEVLKALIFVCLTEKGTVLWQELDAGKEA